MVLLWLLNKVLILRLYEILFIMYVCIQFKNLRMERLNVFGTNYCVFYLSIDFFSFYIKK